MIWIAIIILKCTKNTRILKFPYTVLIQENTNQKKFCIGKLFRQWLHSKHQNPLKLIIKIKSNKCITLFLEFEAIFLTRLVFLRTVFRLQACISHFHYATFLCGQLIQNQVLTPYVKWPIIDLSIFRFLLQIILHLKLFEFAVNSLLILIFFGI